MNQHRLPAAAALPAIALGFLLSACSGLPMSSPSDAATPFGPIRETVHRGDDDLLSAGLGIEGLRAPVPPTIEQAGQPRPAELRRRAIWANWRGIGDLRPGGAAGDTLPRVPGREFSTFATVPGASQPHRVLLQLPDSFDPGRPCLIVAPASGSRGVYGAIAVAAPWALPRGCAVAYTDRGAGTDYVDLAQPFGNTLAGTLQEAGAENAETLAFQPRTSARSGLAFKHAHSQDNPEADWGQHVRQAAAFGLQVLNQQWPEHGPFNAANTRIIAVGISNGGGAVLRAAEHEDDLLDAVVAGEPNVYADAPGSRPLYDYATLAARLMPCALLDMDNLPQPPLQAALKQAGAVRCASLKARGELQGETLAEQAKEARALLQAAGFDDYALHAGASSSGFDLWRSVAVAYASAYGRFPAGEHPCGFNYVLQDADGSPRPASRAEHSQWWSDASGIPPAPGIALHDPHRTGDDPDLPGLDCLRALWEGDGQEALRVQQGVAATRAKPPRAGLPVIVVHGRDDGLIPMAFSSTPYVAMAQAAGRPVSFWQIPRAQHFDAFLALPDYGTRYVPLMPHIHTALDTVWAQLEERDSGFEMTGHASVENGDS